jgi:hypothetical protein
LFTRLVEFPDDEPTFKELVQEYLFSPEGRHHLQDLKVEGSILDLEGNFNITVELYFNFILFFVFLFFCFLLLQIEFTLFRAFVLTEFIFYWQGSRARFHHLSLKNASAKNKALESITTLSNDVVFGDDVDLSSPIIFTHSYIEWEANRVSSYNKPQKILNDGNEMNRVHVVAAAGD